MKLLVTLLTGLIVGGVVLFSILANTGRIAGPEHYAAAIAAVLPFGYAFAAGMVASVNPCGFFMLPAFVGYQLGTGEANPEMGPTQLLRALLLGVTITLGFLSLFALIGSAVAGGGHALVQAFPWVGLAVGVAMAVVGLWLLATGRSLGLPLASRVTSPNGRGLGAVFLYGVAYGAVSLSCTLPIFLVVVGTSLAASGFVASVGQFVSYALGMGVVIIAVTMGVAAFKGALAARLKGVAQHLHRLSAVFLLGAGAYLIMYWVWLGQVFR